MGADLIVVTNELTQIETQFSGVSFIISGDKAKEIVQAVSSGRRYKYGMDPGVFWEWELQFYRATNHLASAFFEGEAFSGDSGLIYEDETGVLKKLDREIVEQTKQPENR